MKSAYLRLALAAGLVLPGCQSGFSVHVVPLRPQPEDRVSLAILWIKEGATLQGVLQNLAAAEDAQVRVPQAEGTRPRLKVIDVAAQDHTWNPVFARVVADPRVQLAWPDAALSPGGNKSGGTRYVPPSQILSLYDLEYPGDVAEGYFVVLDPGKAYDLQKRGDWLLQFYPTCQSTSTTRISYNNAAQDRHFVITVQAVEGGRREIAVDIEAPSKDVARVVSRAQELAPRDE